MNERLANALRVVSGLRISNAQFGLKRQAGLGLKSISLND